MKQPEPKSEIPVFAPARLEVSQLGFSYPDGTRIYEDVHFEAEPGQIIGVTGPVACGKSTLGKTFLCEYSKHSYEGNIRFNGKELGQMSPEQRMHVVGYLGHDPELFDDSVKNNILLGEQNKEIMQYLKAVCFDEEVSAMAQGADTIVGNSGVRLSGGQAQRLALARTLYHKRPLLILDDPFSALDLATERQVFEHLKEMASDSIILLLSHRLYLFPELDQIIWLENGRGHTGTHDELMQSEPGYAKLYREQEGGTKK